MDDKRKLCLICGQLLSFFAYYRHANDVTGLVCPGRLHLPVENTSEDDLSLSDLDVNNMDESFNFTSSSSLENEDFDFIDHTSSVQLNDDDADCDDDCLDFLTDSDEEIWNSSEDDDIIDTIKVELDPHVQKAQVILFDLAFFLNYFQLTY